MRLLLQRSENTTDGVFGMLAVPGAPALLYTMEDDWKDNQRRESCIPAGLYRLERGQFPKHGETFQVMDVPDRSAILIHPANTEEDVEGCIGVGMRRGFLNVPDEDVPGSPVTRKRAVVESRSAFGRFMEWMRGVDEAELDIQWEGGVAP